MLENKDLFKTRRTIDGKDYVEINEVLDLFKSLASVPSFFTGVADTLHKIQGDMNRSISREFPETFVSTDTSGIS